MSQAVRAHGLGRQQWTTHSLSLCHCRLALQYRERGVGVGGWGEGKGAPLVSLQSTQAVIVSLFIVDNSKVLVVVDGYAAMVALITLFQPLLFWFHV